jgi:y4mF family transcriptional regulator
MTVAEFVKEQRKKQHWTQKDLAFYGGVGLRFIRELEQGKTTLRMDKVNQILDMFGGVLTVGPTDRSVYA